MVTPGDFPGKPRLADARLARDEHQPALPVQRLLQRGPERGQFSLPPDNHRAKHVRHPDIVGCPASASTAGWRSIGQPMHRRPPRPARPQPSLVHHRPLPGEERPDYRMHHDSARLGGLRHRVARNGRSRLSSQTPPNPAPNQEAPGPAVPTAGRFVPAASSPRRSSTPESCSSGRATARRAASRRGLAPKCGQEPPDRRSWRPTNSIQWSWPEWPLAAACSSFPPGRS